MSGPEAGAFVCGGAKVLVLLTLVLVVLEDSVESDRSEHPDCDLDRGAGRLCFWIDEVEDEDGMLALEVEATLDALL